MDSLTQACLGGALGGAVLGRRLGRRSVLLGAVAATLPDLDSFIDFGSAVADYTFHRSFSHSLLTLTALAALLTLLCRYLPRAREIPSRQWWWFWWLTLGTHPLLDAFTTYGTQLLWPLLPPPTAWSTLFIIDPLFTLPLLIAVIVVLVRDTPGRAPVVGLGVAGLYLIFSILAKAAVMERVTPALIERGLDDRPVMVQPMPLTTLLWRVTVIDDERQLEALVSLFDGDRALRFDHFQRPMTDADRAHEFWSGRRLGWFSGPFRRIQALDDALVVTDLRMGLPGGYAFAFAIAERDENGTWQAIDAREVETGRAGLSSLPLLVERIASSEALCPADFGDRALVLSDSKCSSPAPNG